MKNLHIDIQQEKIKSIIHGADGEALKAGIQADIQKKYKEAELALEIGFSELQEKTKGFDNLLSLESSVKNIVNKITGEANNCIALIKPLKLEASRYLKNLRAYEYLHDIRTPPHAGAPQPLRVILFLLAGILIETIANAALLGGSGEFTGMGEAIGTSASLSAGIVGFSAAIGGFSSHYWKSSVFNMRILARVSLVGFAMTLAFVTLMFSYFRIGEGYDLLDYILGATAFMITVIVIMLSIAKGRKLFPSEHYSLYKNTIGTLVNRAECERDDALDEVQDLREDVLALVDEEEERIHQALENWQKDLMEIVKKHQDFLTYGTDLQNEYEVFDGLFRDLSKAIAGENIEAEQPAKLNGKYSNSNFDPCFNEAKVEQQIQNSFQKLQEFRERILNVSDEAQTNIRNAYTGFLQSLSYQTDEEETL